MLNELQRHGVAVFRHPERNGLPKINTFGGDQWRGDDYRERISDHLRHGDEAGILDVGADEHLAGAQCSSEDRS